MKRILDKNLFKDYFKEKIIKLKCYWGYPELTTVEEKKQQKFEEEKKIEEKGKKNIINKY